jgi:hypothetical protein
MEAARSQLLIETGNKVAEDFDSNQKQRAKVNKRM